MHTQSSAVLSRCKRYRYELERSWSTRPSRQSTVVFIGLNPSTADASTDDPTIRKCMAYARSWEFDRMIMINLFAWRATDPNLLLEAKNPVGSQNDKHICSAVKKAAMVVACWGEYGTLLDRANEIRARYPRRLHCLKTNQSGEPTHPLYLPATLTPIKLAKARQRLK